MANKRLCILLFLLIALAVCPTSPSAQVNIALGKTVHLVGDGFFDGAPEPLADPQTVTDGIFLPRYTPWNGGTVWWLQWSCNDNGAPCSIEIDLEWPHRIDGLIFQGENGPPGELYNIDFWDLDTEAWQLAWAVPVVAGGDVQTRPNPADDTEIHPLEPSIVTNRLRISPVMSNWDAVSEVQAFGELADTDSDGLNDYIESLLGSDPGDSDTDDDGLLDGDEDRNANGVWDAGETDALDADTDDDGVADGDEDVNANGVVNAIETDPLDPDTDGDFLNDGLEQGLTAGVPGGVSSPGGIPYTGTSGWTPDADSASQTDPLDPDSDNDGINDGAEDGDGNGLRDGFETDPMDADSDDDGIADGDESAMLLDPLDPDADADGLSDGLEIGRGTKVATGVSAVRSLPYAGTAGYWVPDGDGGATTTDPLDADSDNDGFSDGDADVPAAGAVAGEDLNVNGIVDASESDPADADTDDDGIADGDELALGLDPLDPDYDDDELSDGLELGVTQPVASGNSSGAYAPNRVAYLGTSLSWTPDSDNGTTTDPIEPDSDDDGLRDGTEDADHDGAVDETETDPNDPDTDEDGWKDGDEVTKGSDPLDPDSVPLDAFFSDGFETIPAALCGQCVTDDDCLEPTDQCLALVGGFYCGQDSSDGNPHGTPEGVCPDGYSCQNMMDGFQCVPVTFSCTCNASNEGEPRSCSNTNEHGTCEGIEICDAALGWVGCDAPTPSPGGCL